MRDFLVGDSILLTLVLLPFIVAAAFLLVRYICRKSELQAANRRAKEL